MILTPTLHDWKGVLLRHFPHRIIIPKLADMVIDAHPGDPDEYATDCRAWCAEQFGPDGTGDVVICGQVSSDFWPISEAVHFGVNPAVDRIRIDTRAAWASRNWQFFFKDEREAVLFKFYAV